MMQREPSLSEQELQATWDRLAGVADDRRRPERLDHVNPTLIPLLRGTLAPGLPLNDGADLAHNRGELAPAAGIAVSVVLSALLWAVIGFAGWAVLG